MYLTFLVKFHRTKEKVEIYPKEEMECVKKNPFCNEFQPPRWPNSIKKLMYLKFKNRVKYYFKKKNNIHFYYSYLSNPIGTYHELVIVDPNGWHNGRIFIS